MWVLWWCPLTAFFGLRFPDQLVFFSFFRCWRRCCCHHHFSVLMKSLADHVDIAFGAFTSVERWLSFYNFFTRVIGGKGDRNGVLTYGVLRSRRKNTFSTTRFFQTPIMMGKCPRRILLPIDLSCRRQDDKAVHSGDVKTIVTATRRFPSPALLEELDLVRSAFSMTKTQGVSTWGIVMILSSIGHPPTPLSVAKPSCTNLFESKGNCSFPIHDRVFPTFCVVHWDLKGCA